MQKNDCVALPLRVLARHMSEGHLSSLTLVQHCLRRIESENRRLNAFVRVFDGLALERAVHLDAERAQKGPRGPLHGIPVAIKDLVDFEGDVTGFGSSAYATAPAKSTAPFVKELEDAGMIVIGKTQMVEFAFGSWGTNHVLGTPRNPHALEDHFVPGGSSSGSAVAVAAGLVPAAIGSDTGGSVRIPAALCGIVGLKTTSGLVATEGVAPLSTTLDTIGPMARRVEDVRLLFEAMHAPRPRSLAKNVKACVCSLERHALEPLDAEVWDAYVKTLKRLGGLGLPIRPITLPRPLADYQKDSGSIMAREAYLALRHLVDDPATPLDPFVRARVMQGANVSEGMLESLLTERKAAIEAFATILAGNEVLVLPTTPRPAVPLREVDESAFPMSRFTRMANYLDLCGLSLPCGRAQNGMPVGVQLIAAGGNEMMLLSLAERLQGAM